MNARQSSRLLSLVLFAALCALLTHWVLTLSSLRSLGAPREARVAQTDALETGAAVTLFGGGPQNGPRDVQIMGVVADLADGSGAAIVSMDGGAPQAVRAGMDVLLFSNTANYHAGLAGEILGVLVAEAEQDPAFAARIEQSYDRIVALKARIR